MTEQAEDRVGRYLSYFFDYTRQVSEVLFEMKLNLFEQSTVALMRAAAESGNAANLAAVTDTAAAANVVASNATSKKKPQPTDFTDLADVMVQSIFSQLPSGFDEKEESTAISASSSNESKKAEFDPFLYGELEPAGVRQVAAHVVDALRFDAAATINTKRSGENANDDADDHKPSSNMCCCTDVAFVDLGSGVGKLVIDMALVFNGFIAPSFADDSKNKNENNNDGAADGLRRLPPLCSIGVELDKRRAAVADMALQQLKIFASSSSSSSTAGDVDEQPGKNKKADSTDEIMASLCRVASDKVCFVQGDMLADDMLFATKVSLPAASSSPSSSAAVIRGVFAFCCGVAFDKEMCSRIVRRVVEVDAAGGDETKKTATTTTQQQQVRLLGGVFLFKEWPFVEESLGKTAPGSDDVVNKKFVPLPAGEAAAANCFWKIKKIALATSWMSEAPAFLMFRD